MQTTIYKPMLYFHPKNANSYLKLPVEIQIDVFFTNCVFVEKLLTDDFHLYSLDIPELFVKGSCSSFFSSVVYLSL